MHQRPARSTQNRRRTTTFLERAISVVKQLFSDIRGSFCCYARPTSSFLHTQEEHSAEAGGTSNTTSLQLAVAAAKHTRSLEIGILEKLRPEQRAR
jgi:hypothetical protein